MKLIKWTLWNVIDEIKVIHKIQLIEINKWHQNWYETILGCLSILRYLSISSYLIISRYLRISSYLMGLP